MKTITPVQLNELRAADPGLDLVDVRTPAEFREVHVEGARNLPLDKFDAKKILASRNGSSGKPIYVICNSGNRSSKACRQLLEQGGDQVINVEGGTKAFVEAGLHVIRGKKTVSLERQVRIEGKVERISEADSAAYFITRDPLSRIGAWASPQSEVIDGRGELEARFREMEDRFKAVKEVPRPPHWGAGSWWTMHILL